MGRSINLRIHVPRDMSPTSTPTLALVLGWINGVLIALVLDFALYSVLGPSYPQGPATVLLFAIFALSGAKLAERMGARALHPMAIATGILVAFYVAVGLTVWMSHAS